MINDRFYYSTLNERNKRIYKAIYNGIMNYDDYVEVPGIELNENVVGYIYHCVVFDNPFFFSVGEYAMHHALESDGKRIRITTLCDRKTEQYLRHQVECVVNKLLSNPLLKNMTDFQKEVYVHDFILNNVTYDKTCGNGGERLQPYTVYGALVERKAVCEGIAKTVKLLLNLLNIKCIVVNGKVDGGGHSWNIVKLHDFAYHLDVTFDLGRVVHKGFMRYEYFNLTTNEILSGKRTIENEHLFPKCTATGYNYYHVSGAFISNTERLKKHFERQIQKRRKSIFVRVNRIVNEEFRDIADLTPIIEKYIFETAKKLGVNVEVFLDVSGGFDIYNIEVTYY